MPRSVKLFLHLVDAQHSVLVAVKEGESLSDDVEAILIEIAEDGGNELVKVDGAVAVSIEYLEDLVGLWSRAADAVIVKGLAELLEVELATAVGVHDLELPLESNKTLGTSLDEFLTETPNDQLILLQMSQGPQGLLCRNTTGWLCGLQVLHVLGADSGVKGVSS